MQIHLSNFRFWNLLVLFTGLFLVASLVLAGVRYHREYRTCISILHNHCTICTDVVARRGEIMNLRPNAQKAFQEYAKDAKFRRMILLDREYNILLDTHCGPLPADPALTEPGKLQIMSPTIWDEFRLEPDKDYIMMLPLNEGTMYIMYQLGMADLVPKTIFPKFHHLQGLILMSILMVPFLLLYLATLQIWENLLRQKEYQLVHAGRLSSIGELTAGVAHEINQPLCVIRGYLELLQMKLAGTEIAKKNHLDGAFTSSMKCVNRVSDIVANLRRFVYFSVSESPAGDLKASVDFATTFYQEQFRQHNIEFLVSVEENLPPIQICAQRFEQIIVNLLSNALYAVDKQAERVRSKDYKKQITLTIRRAVARERVILVVSDNGCGMSPRTQKMCGELFFTTKPIGVGTGLGVSIMKEIIHKSHGEMSISSKENFGTTFRIEFPIV